MTQDTSYHQRRVAEKKEDPEYRSEYERQRKARVYCPDCLHPRLRHNLEGFCLVEKCDCENG